MTPATTTNTEVIVWGGKSQAIVLRSVLERLGKKVVAVFDDTPGLASPFADVPIFQGQAGLETWLASRNASNYGFVVAVGNPHGRARLRIADMLQARGFVPVTVLDPGALIDPTAHVGAGAQVFAGAVVSAHAKVGAQAIVNCAALVEHEAEIDAGVEVAPGAVVLGLSRVDTCATIGTRATVMARTRVGADAIVGAGVFVAQDVAAGAKLYGPIDRMF